MNAETLKKQKTPDKTRRGAVFLALACLLCVLLAPAGARAAGAGEVTLTVEQAFSGATVPPADLNCVYRLTPLEADIPMPAGSTQDGYAFTVAGAADKQIDPIVFTGTGVYTYKLVNETPPKADSPGYIYDRQVYTLWIWVTDGLKTTLVIRGADGVKAEALRFTHGAAAPSDPITMVDPPVQKTVSGQPDSPGVFTFRLAAQNPNNPMPAGSVNGVKTLQITGEGSAEFGPWQYEAEGVYRYTVLEVGGKEKGYTYDSTVYTITDTVRAVNGRLEVSRAVTGKAGSPVSALAFVNVYTGVKDGPKTGDEAQSRLYTALLCLSGIGAVYCAVCLLAGKRRKRMARDEI